MANDIATDVAKYLQAAGVGTIGQNIHVSMKPESPNSVIAVYSTGGSRPHPNEVFNPSCMIHVRGERNGYVGVDSTIQDVIDTLHGIGNFTYLGWYYTKIWLLGDPMFLGYDDNNRPEFSLNFEVQRRKAT